MDTITIKCKGNIEKVLNKPNETLMTFLWDQDFEVTNVKTNDNIIVVYGFETYDGLIKKLLDKRRKESIYCFMEEKEVEVLDLQIGECNDDSWED